MADEEQQAEESKSGGMMPLVLNILVAASAIAAGFATPYLVSGSSGDNDQQNEKKDIPKDDVELDYIEFGDVTANLDEPNLTRYIKVNLSLQVAKAEKEVLSKLIASKKVTLKDWLNGFLASQSMTTIRGRSGHNRLKREIKDHFNSALFLDGVERIRGVLFVDFNVQ